MLFEYFKLKSSMVKQLFSKEFEHAAEYLRHIKSKNIPLAMLYTLFIKKKKKEVCVQMPRHTYILWSLLTAESG